MRHNDLLAMSQRVSEIRLNLSGLHKDAPVPAKEDIHAAEAHLISAQDELDKQYGAAFRRHQGTLPTDVID